MRADCTRCEDAAAYVAEELSPRASAEFEAHLTECAECRTAVDSTRHVIGRLHSLPQVEVARDLAPGVFAELRRDSCEFPQPGRWPRIAALAAVLALFAGGTAVRYLGHSPPQRVPVAAAKNEATGIARALDWFVQNQELDGSWNADKWGGQARFEIALTALPTLALLSSESPTPQRTAAISRAVQWLRDQQTSTGAFGPDFQGAPYNHSIATLALLRAYQRQSDPALKRSLHTALATLIVRQTRDGAWGYAYSPFADRSITDWHAEALELASTLGWDNATAPLARARTWLATHPNPRAGADEPADSPSADLAPSDHAPLDFYSAYFLTAKLLHLPDAGSRQRLAAIRHTLLLHQISTGHESGTWPPDDRWSRAGGRLYSTALAALSLREQL